MQTVTTGFTEAQIATEPTTVRITGPAETDYCRASGSLERATMRLDLLKAAEVIDCSLTFCVNF